ncbi:MAG: flagellar motor switch protein FliN [Leptolyngbya sp. PLA1]|nr:flagellar motor switch protein FliN [Leptolyngbya sp. PLA1]
MADDTTQPTPTDGAGGSPAEAALHAAKNEIDGLGAMAAKAGGGTPAPLPDLTPSLTPAQAKTLGLLSDVQLNVKIELGRAKMLVDDVLQLGEGSVVELDKLAGDPVDLYVNDQHVARGEVLVLNDNFCVRINEILTPGSGAKAKSA